MSAIRFTREIIRQIGEVRSEKPDQAAKRAVVTRVRRCRDEKQMSIAVGCQSRQEFVTQLSAAAAHAIKRTGVRLIDDDELGGGTGEVRPATFRLDVLRGDDGDVVAIEQGLADLASAFVPRGRRRQDDSGFEVEFGAHLLFPLGGKVRGTENGEPLGSPKSEHLGCDQEGRGGLSGTDVVRDEETDRIKPQRHHERDQLVGPRLEVQGPE
jgi:hypothetical protein